LPGRWRPLGVEALYLKTFGEEVLSRESGMPLWVSCSCWALMSGLLARLDGSLIPVLMLYQHGTRCRLAEKRLKLVQSDEC
jgi:hypothetical protein